MFKKIFIFLILIYLVFGPNIYNTKNREKYFSKNSAITNITDIKEAEAMSQFFPTSGTLVKGTETVLSNANVASWRGTLGNDANYWQVAKVNPGGLDLQLSFDNVELYNANKMIITIEDSMVTTGDAFVHQICDWNSTTSVDVAVDAYCTGGGWRTLQPRKTTHVTTADTTRQYEIYNGYFSDRTTTPGLPINTPLSYFINTANKRVLIRTYSTVASVINYRIDVAQIETAIDPVYEPAEFVKTTGGTTVNFYSDLLGAVYTTVTGSDATKLRVPMPGNSQAADFYFKFKNVRKYSGANTILISPEICVSNVALTFGVYLRNFNTSTWTQVGTNITGTACTTDTDYAISFNSTSNPGINIDDYISSSNEIQVRFLTNAPATTYYVEMDRLYLMLGSVNADSSKCEISWGTGTASDCQNTRDVLDTTAAAATASTNTWSNTAVLEYPANHYGLDNDDDAVNAEYASSDNIDFPITVNGSMSVTGIHYAGRYRSNATTMTADLQMRNYAGSSGLGGDAAGAGWTNTPGTDSNALTTYNYFDTWRISEQQNNPEDHINSVTGMGNLKLKTITSTNTTLATVRNWDFAMMSIRWIDLPSSGTLGVDIVDGSNVSVSSPSIIMNNSAFSFSCIDRTGIFGTSTQKIRTTNETSNPSFSLSIAATNGASAKWSASSLYYDYNDPSGSTPGCSDGADADSLAGLLTINPSVASITPKSGCSTSGLSLGSSNYFSEGSINSISILSGGASAATSCYWDISGIDITQKIPAEQTSDSYNINLMLTIASI